MIIEVVEADRPEDETLVYTDEFIECDTCRAKPGSPTLCYGCLNNRALISELKRESNKQE